MPHDVARTVGEVGEWFCVPAWPGPDRDAWSAVVGGVECDPGNDDPGVGAVGVDGDPASGAGLPVVLEFAGVEGGGAEEPGGVEHE